MQRTNLLMGCALLLFSAFALLWLIPNYTIPAFSKLDIPPAFMPYFACTVIAILSLSLAIRSYLAGRRNQQVDESNNSEFHGEVTGFRRDELINFLIWSAFSILAVVGLDFIGFHVTAALMLAAAMFYTGCRNFFLIGAVSVISPILLSLIVWQAFTVRLPPGQFSPF